MSAAGLEALRLRSLRQLGRCGEVRAACGARDAGRDPGRVLPPGRSPPGRAPAVRSPAARSWTRRCAVAARWPIVASRRGRRSPAGPSRRGGRSPRSPRSPRSLRSRLASCWVTPSNGLSLGMRSSRPDFSAFSLVVVTARIVMPSSSTSASAFSTEPILDPSAGSSEPSSTPLGARAPAARHVHVPSGRALVSSISILRDIGPQRYLVRAASLHRETRVVDANGRLTTVASRAHLRPRRPGPVHPSRRLRASRRRRHRIGDDRCRELGLAGRGAAWRRRRDHHRRSARRAGQLRAAHDRTSTPRSSATTA